MVELKHKGIKIKIIRDESPLNPREDWDNFGTMVINNRRYPQLGDSHVINPIDRDDLDSTKDVVLPLYMYDHGGVSISTEPFGCDWDSRMVGYIYATEETIKAEFGMYDLTSDMRDDALKILLAEVEIYNSYINGEVYMYQVEDDYCGGFYSLKEAREAAEEVADYIVSERRKKHYQKLKAMIKAGVNIIYREALSI